ncbi:hypothetical protein [Arthrobacter cryoconiti]|uniref:Uncharacterized protein n=1 Tax=Arthrobacter cryoconiti TaxID=748907 RepID=A0ABV8QX57_9MICC|nr:hypothetical protein [Arthrobacter cryoconiti]MCC9069000.1 hypothetical protein [Arthrobacter cryoconiti]
MGHTSKAARTALLIFIATQHILALWLAAAGKRLPAGLRAGAENDRGDVPGWVLITLMSAVLVAGLLAIAGPALEKMFNEAMAQVQP